MRTRYAAELRKYVYRTRSESSTSGLMESIIDNPFLCHDGATDFAKTDANRAATFAPAAQNQRVAVLQEGPLLAVGELDGLLAALGQLEQGAGFVGCGAR